MQQPKQPMSVYLADDDEDDVELFRELIADMFGHISLQVAENGIELIRLLKSSLSLPDLIFLDMNMPIKNGVQCLQEIKEHALWKNIRIVMLSTSSSPDQIETTRNKGADCYMIKSTSFTQFKKNLSACINNELGKSSFIVN